jgi:metal-dependent amidase/aminoacylase/carboxypeptidase family protein
VLANIDTTSENLQKIKDQLYDFAELGFVEVNTARNRNQPWFKVVV